MAMKDICDVQFEQARHGVAGETILVAPRRPLMDHPGPDPAARAAADVQRLLGQAPHLRRIVEVAEAVAAGQDPGAAEQAPDLGDDQHPVDGNEQA